MRVQLCRIVALLMLLSMALGACAQPEQQAPLQPETVVQTVEVVKTVEIQKEGKTVVVTATPEPVKPTEPGPAGPKVVSFNLLNGDIPTLDPALAEDSASIEVLVQTYTGLTTLDEESLELKPGVAEKWDISPDGKVYTFHLRKDLPWVRYDASKKQVVKVAGCDGNDRMLNAFDFEYGFKRTIAPKTASPYAYLLDFVLEGAQAFTDGKEQDATKVGVTAVNTYTLEIKFLEAAAYNPMIAGLWVGYAQPRWLIEGDDCTEARGERWIEAGFNQSYGGFVLKEWQHDAQATIIKNPFYPGTAAIPQPTLDEVVFTMLDETAAFAEYESGNLHVSQVPLADMDRVKTDAVLSKELNIAPSLSTYYFGFNTTAPIVDDVRVRRALSLAVDRQKLIDNVLKANQEPAAYFCRPGLVACPDPKAYPDLGVHFNPEKAKATLQEYLDEKKTTADQLDLTLMYNTSTNHQKVAEAIQQMWKDTLGVNVKLVNQEWKVFLNTTKGKDTPQIFRSSWNPDYPDANNFTREVCAAGGSQNPFKNGKPEGGFFWKNDKFEELVRQAAVEMDPQKRIDLYAQAEQILVYDDAVMIPVYWFTRVSVTKPNVVRTFGLTGHQNFAKWDIK